MKAAGWGLFAAALAAICSMLGAEVAKFGSWSDGMTPQLVGTALMHVGAVVGAFVGGKLIPAPPAPREPWTAEERAQRTGQIT